MKSVAEHTNSTSGSSSQATGVLRSSGIVADAPAARRNRTHVLYVIDSLCEMGGAERVLLNMIRLLPREEFRCSLVTFKIEPSLEIFQNFPCPWQHLPVRRTWDPDGFRAALEIRRTIRRENVHIVHTFHETSDLWGGLVAKLSGAPVLVSSRRDMGILRRPFHHRSYRLLNPLYDHVLAVSDRVRAYCIEHDRLPAAKVTTLYNGIELEKVAASNHAGALRASLGLAGASHIISSVAHVRRIKGLDVMIRAAALVCREFPRAVFLIIGDNHEPPHFQELQQLTASLRLADNVRFLGSSEQVFSLLQMSDVFCLPSRSEGFSNALVEAMACGLPCVATRVGGNAEALEEGRSGFLVDAEDSTAMAERLLRLLRQPDRARQMGRAARQTVEEKFTHEAMIRHLVQVYERLLADKQR